MFTFSQMMVNLVVAILLGALMGLERELVGKEAGIRTSMTVAAGAALFTMVGLSLPYLISNSPDVITQVLERNSGFLAAIGNVVVGIGFLGAGIIIKTENRVHGLTTAAVIWATAAIGIVAGLGLLKFALVATVIIAGMLYLTRRIDISGTSNANRG